MQTFFALGIFLPLDILLKGQLKQWKTVLCTLVIYIIGDPFVDFFMIILTLSWRRTLSYRSQSIDWVRYLKPSLVDPTTLLKKRLWHRYFPVKFAKFHRTTFIQNSSTQLLLFISFQICRTLLKTCNRQSHKMVKHTQAIRRQLAELKELKPVHYKFHALSQSFSKMSNFGFNFNFKFSC